MKRALRIAAFGALVVVYGISFCSTAYADDATATVTNVANTGGTLAVLAGTVLPLIVGLVNRYTPGNWNPGVKATVLLLLSAIDALLGQALDAQMSGEPFIWQSVIPSAFLTFAIAVFTHREIWKKTGVSDKVNGTEFIPRHEAPS